LKNVFDFIQNATAFATALNISSLQKYLQKAPPDSAKHDTTWRLW